MEQQDFLPGDPARHVVGRPEEKAARVYALPKKRQRHLSEKTILADIKLRRQELEPLVVEYQRLRAGYDAIKDI